MTHRLFTFKNRTFNTDQIVAIVDNSALEDYNVKRATFPSKKCLVTFSNGDHLTIAGISRVEAIELIYGDVKDVFPN